MIKNRLLYIFVLILAIAFVFLYSGKIVYITLYSIILIPVFSFFTTFMLKSSLKITQSIDSDFILKGQMIKYNVEITNKSILSFTGTRVVFVDKKFGVVSNATEEFTTLAALSTYKRDFEMSFKYRGSYEIGIDHIELQDFLGLFRFKNIIRQKLNIIVYPRIVEINRFPLSQNLLARSQSNRDISEEDYTTVSDIRKYQSTDSFKKIHWKLSAKKDELIVKNYQATAANGIAILLDLCNYGQVKRDAVEIEDKTIETSVAITDYCLKRRIQVEFVYGYGSLLRKTATGITDFNSLYTTISGLEFQNAIHVDQLVFDFLNQQDDFTNIVILTSNVNSSLYETILKAQGFGHNVVLIYFKDCGYNPDISEYLGDLSQVGISNFSVSLYDKIEDIF